jgi:hypothetical protein
MMSTSKQMSFDDGARAELDIAETSDVGIREEEGDVVVIRHRRGSWSAFATCRLGSSGATIAKAFGAWCPRAISSSEAMRPIGRGMNQFVPSVQRDTSCFSTSTLVTAARLTRRI